MPSFAGVPFVVTEESFSDKSGLLEQLALKIIVADSTTWGALFSHVTPSEMISVRSSYSMAGVSTIVVDLGGGFGVGALVFEGGELDDHDALLVELSSEAPMAVGGPRVAHATFHLIPA